MISFSAIVNDLAQWNAIGSPTRREIAAEIAKKLGPDYLFVGSKTYVVGGQTHEIMSVEHNPTKLVFSIIPGGTFLMGNSDAEQAICALNKWNGDIPETPVQKVGLRAFLMAEFTTTEHAWRAFTGTKDTPWEAGEFFPKDAVSRSQARLWCRHFGFRLPSEAEWEYACRAGTTSVFYWGDAPDPSHCWMKSNYGGGDEYKGHSSREHLHKTNAFGLIDMLGSLGEWVQDDRHKYEWHNPNDGCYESDDPKSDGILRGGCFMYDWKFNRCATRIACSDYGDSGIGFRAAKDIPALEGMFDENKVEIGKSVRQNPSGEGGAEKKPWWKPW